MMTTEEVESRLRSLQTPAPPERLRERCLRGHPGTRRPRAAFAVAGSFLVVALSVWLTLAPKPPVRPADRILPPPAHVAASADDRILKDKVERLLRENSGKGVLVVRVRELRDGSFLPVTHGFSLRILLEDAREVPDPLVTPDGPRADVDLDGTLLYVKSPGVYRGVGFSDEADERLKKLCFTWEYKDLALNPGGVVILSDALFAPWLRWTSPAEGGLVSIKEDPRISWVPYPEITSVKIEIQRVQIFADRTISWEGRGELKHDALKDAGIPLSEILKASRPSLAGGERVALQIIGYDSQGRVLTRCQDKLQFVLKD
jgi:hypothetical protein